MTLNNDILKMKRDYEIGFHQMKHPPLVETMLKSQTNT